MTKKIRCLISAGPTREWIDPVRLSPTHLRAKWIRFGREALARFEVDLQRTGVLPRLWVRVHHIMTAVEQTKGN